MNVEESRTDLASEFKFTCPCGTSVSLETSKKIANVGSGLYAINRRFPYAITSIGRHHTQGQRLLANLDIPSNSSAVKWGRHLKAIHKATSTAAIESMLRAAEAVQEKDENVTNIHASCDGTWQRRGFSSKNGVCTVLSVEKNMSKVLDTQTLTNYCNACINSKKKMTDEEFQSWQRTHECSKNHHGSAGSMEPAGMEQIFRRSAATRKLQYTGYLGDGDSKSFALVSGAQPQIYDTDIEKLECCGHVQKRMGKRLMDKVKQCKHKIYVHEGKKVTGIGGARKLSQKAIKRIQGHYGGAIRANTGSLEDMKKAVWAIWEHRGGQHTNCGKWCPLKSGHGDPDKNQLPQYILDEIKPIFTALSSDELLKKCLHGGTQNSNESFHHIIWERCPKEIFVGRVRLEVAVAEATVVYNDGEVTRLGIFDKLGLDVGVHCLQYFSRTDNMRVKRSRKQRSVDQRRERAIADAHMNSDPTYSAGGF